MAVAVPRLQVVAETRLPREALVARWVAPQVRALDFFLRRWMRKQLARKALLASGHFA